MNLQPNTLLQGGKYKIINKLGQGGFGITYLAEQVMLGRKVAVKEFFMKELCNRDSETSQVSVGTVGSLDMVERFKEKFLKEARLIATMDNNHIVRIHDIFEENGTAYYIMENVDGGSLESMANGHPIDEALALKYVREVADALKYIHAQNVLHLDVKPSNILIRKNGDAVLIDFGISKRYDEQGGQTSTSPVGISKGYAPTEQYNQGVTNFSPATDIYSLGATLYKILTGVTPPEASLLLNEDDELQKPDGISFRTWCAIEKAMEPKRKKRPQSIDEFLNLIGYAEPVSSSIATSVGDETIVAMSKEKKDDIQTPTQQDNVTDTDSTILVDNMNEVPTASKVDIKDDATVLINSHSADVVDLGLSVNWCICNLGAKTPQSNGNFYVLNSMRNLNVETLNGLRLPTKEEWNELIEKCEYEWKDSQIKNFKGTNGNVLTIPVSGRYYDNESDQLYETAFYWAAPNKHDNRFWFARMTVKDASANNVIARTKTNVAMTIRLVQDK